MSNKLASLLAFAMAGLASSAHADLITAGTAELVTVRSCIAVVGPCDNVSSVLGFSYGGFAGAYSSSAFGDWTGWGSAAGSVRLSGVVGAPLLSAIASSNPGYRTNTNSLALQRYIYTGTTTTTRTFGATLTYDQDVSGIYAQDVGTGVVGSIDVFTLPAGTVDVGSTPQSNFDTLFNVSGLPGYHELASDGFNDLTASVHNGSHSLAATVTLNPNDTIWVWALLQTPATNGSTVDASHTLITSWDNPASLVPAAVAAAVPEPATAALLTLGLAAAAGVARRQRKTLSCRIR